jgi:hypothetical protein
MGNHPRETPPPSRYGKSKTGTYFYLIHTTHRDHMGRKLYRLRFDHGGAGTTWTMEQLEEAGIRWLKNRPSAL